MAGLGGLRWRPKRADAVWIGVVGLVVGATAAALVAFVSRAEPTANQVVWITAAGVLVAGAGGLVTAGRRSRGERADARDLALQQHTRGGILRVKS